MEQFKGKVAVVTGASSGIGASIATVLAEAGLKVVGVARRKEKIEELAKTLKAGSGELYAVRADLTKEDDILQAFKWISENVGPVRVLVNNAGLNITTDIIDGDTEKWKTILDTNVLGLTIASREAIRIMRDNNIDGHIVNINSVVGHKVPSYEGLSLYPASKYAVRALTETLRLELVRLKSKIKVTNLSPGLVDTEAVKDIISSIEDYFPGVKPLNGVDIANGVKYVIATPPHVQITELTIRPVGEVL